MTWVEERRVVYPLSSNLESSLLRATCPMDSYAPPSPTLLRGGIILQHDSNDNVQVLHDTDLLIEDGIIVKIGKSISSSFNTKVIDCNGKIISPGFIDTHHHLWQTQLKGRHWDHTQFDYMPAGKPSEIL